MPRKASRRAAPARPARASVLFGVCTVGDHEFWAAWLDGADVVTCLATPPSGFGFVRRPHVVAEIVDALASSIFGVTKAATPGGAEAARAWLSSRVTRRSLSYRADEVALNAWHQLGCPMPPGAVAAAGPAPADPPSWTKTLGVGWPTTEVEVTAAYRRAAAAAHPDAPGGSADTFRRVQRAYDMAKGWLAEQEEARGGG